MDIGWAIQKILEDPMWILVVITAVYATFTYLSVRESKNFRKDLWRREKARYEKEDKKREEEIARLRNLIAFEIMINLSKLDIYLDVVKKIKEDFKLGKRKIEMQEQSFFNAIYKTYLSKLEILPSDEAWTIADIYYYLELTYNFYNYTANEINKILKQGLLKEKAKDAIFSLNCLEHQILKNIDVIKLWKQSYKEKLSEYEFDKTLEKEIMKIKKQI